MPGTHEACATSGPRNPPETANGRLSQAWLSGETAHDLAFCVSRCLCAQSGIWGFWEASWGLFLPPPIWDLRPTQRTP
uniref:Uncharacterized protein n=1 Tax=Human herpesvirus 1 TaxID=10298 RepID=A0A2Z4H864_HHV1|nr:hypothetical protein [Human alphaherpesvirus 1]AWW11004.1 hypothetical protein [Human alphaherpesvirus 1]